MNGPHIGLPRSIMFVEQWVPGIASGSATATVVAVAKRAVRSETGKVSDRSTRERPSMGLSRVLRRLDASLTGAARGSATAPVAVRYPGGIHPPAPSIGLVREAPPVARSARRIGTPNGFPPGWQPFPLPGPRDTVAAGRIDKVGRRVAAGRRAQTPAGPSATGTLRVGSRCP